MADENLNGKSGPIQNIDGLQNPPPAHWFKRLTRMARFIIILLFGFLVGCASTSHDTFREFSREIVLSTAHPKDDFIGARLVEIADDGTTTILVTPSGPELRAVVGGYFVSAEYGTHGLQLISASADKKEAKFLRSWAE